MHMCFFQKLCSLKALTNPINMSQQLLKDSLNEFEHFSSTGNKTKGFKKRQKERKLQKSKMSKADDKFIEIYKALRYNNEHLVSLKKAHDKVYSKKTNEKSNNNKKNQSVFTEEDFARVRI